MEKKNTMLLTVIAVATLLVAVVGATFAYFSLTVDGTGSTTATVNTGKVGTVTYSTKEGNLQLGVSAQDMSKETSTGGDVTYYAVAGTYSPGSFVHGSAETAVAIADVSLSGADTGDTYTCSATLKVTVSGKMLTNLSAEWVKLALSGTLVSDVEGADDIDISEMKEETTKTFNINNFTLTEGQSKDVKALLSLVNSQSADQSIIADSDLQVKIDLEPVEGSCKVSKAG